MFLDFTIGAFLDIQHPASNIGPENATGKSFPECQIEEILVGVEMKRAQT